ncbi:MAG: exodeoxyribonuclease VII large subunit, partial [Gammaproteobacteria bacterium]|nr:exodeoxyribonuclease VII large subunit [Gammaproteobacteria bacterium]
GQQVMIRARISVYEPRGEYQLLADFIEPAGDGLLRLQYEQLKAKLASEGLFSEERKKPLPSKVATIGVITSPTGAAIRDILTVLARRAPAIKVIIYPSLVQGAQAASDLTAALRLAIRRHECDVLIIGRGGGSLEDMWCFNDETLARTIADCPIPIVSAVGHEIDFSISDYVADLRAATPSAAAELVSPDQQHQLSQLLQLKQRLAQGIRQRLGVSAQMFLHQHSKLQLLHPARRLQQQQQRLDELQIRLTQAMQQRLQRKTQQLQLQQKSLKLLSPAQRLQRQSQQLQQLQQQLQQAMVRKQHKLLQQWQWLSSQLHTVSPLATLQRGYSIVFTPDGSVVKDQQQVAIGSQVQVRLASGGFTAAVAQHNTPSPSATTQS